MQAKIESIRLSHIQTRSSYKEETINDLANSIKEYGILEPLIVREVNNGFELIAGCRRLRAAQKVGLTSVPIEVKKLSDDDVLFVQLIENIQREEISDYDVGKIFSELSKKLTQQQIAEKVGFSIRHIQRFIEHYKFCESSLRPIGHNVDFTPLKESQTRELRTEIKEPKVQQIVKDWDKAKITKDDLREIWREIRTDCGPEQREDVKNFLQTHDILTSVVRYEDRGNFGNANFHGNSPPFLLIQLINQYRPKNVYDPMEGGFTNRDVCQVMNVAYVGNDLNEENGYDLVEVDEAQIPKSDLTFFHPPYWDLIKYSSKPNDLSNAESWEIFIDKLRICIVKLLHKTKLLVLLIGDVSKPPHYYTPLIILGDFANRIIRILVHEYTIKTGLHAFYQSISFGQIPIVHDYVLIIKGDLP